MIDFSYLSSEQRDALDVSRHVFVEASAGSGKTAVLVARYLHILGSFPDSDPTQILAVTYTRKAAAEMRMRVRDALLATEQTTLDAAIRLQQHLYRLPFAPIMTVHAFCKDIVDSYMPGLPTYVPDEDDRRLVWGQAISVVVSALLAQRDKDLQFLLSLYTLAQIQDMLLSLYGKEPLGLSDATALSRVFAQVYARFQSEKSRLGWLDFSDMVHYCARLVAENYTVAAQLYAQYRFVLVDEFQDTDSVQWDLLQQLFLRYDPPRNLFFVGDMKQSIYGFRGAEPALFREVREWIRDHGGRIVQLTKNYRAQPPLLAFCNSVFPDILDMDYTALQPVKSEHNRHVYIGLSNTSELDLMVSWIHWMRKKHGADWSDFAVLSRRTTGVEAFGEALHALGIPTQYHGLDGGYAVSTVYQGIYLLVSVLVYPHDQVSWYGILRTPIFGSDAYLWRSDVLGHLFSGNTGPQFVPAALLSFYMTVVTIRKKMPLWQALQYLLRQIEQWCDEGARVVGLLREWELRLTDSEKLLRIGEWIRSGAMVPKQVASGVQLMTIHKSKGLEFPFVIVPECHKSFHASRARRVLVNADGILGRQPGEDAQFKTQLTEAERAGLAEEKRNFYVACTRAKEELLLTGSETLGEKEKERITCFWDFLSPYARVSEDDVLFSFAAPYRCLRWKG